MKKPLKPCQRCKRAGVAVLGDYCARCWPLVVKKQKAGH